MNNLLDLLAKDSLKVGALERIYAVHHDDSDFVTGAISAMRQLDADIAWRAVWLLKRHALEGKLSEADLERLALCAEEMTHWASRLNLCQLFAGTGCPHTVRDAVYPYFVECFSNRRPMIRAWAISVLSEFQKDPKYRKPVAAMLLQAKADPAASVVARLRRLTSTRPQSPKRNSSQW
ncbi:MAG: hypothetical protein QM715_17265 [Nibricoccus sp.]